MTRHDRRMHRLPAVVQGVGWLFLFWTVGNYFYFSGGGLSAVLTVDFVVSMVANVPFAAGIIVGGFWLGNSEIEPTRYRRIGVWFVGGLGCFLLLNVAMILTWPTGSLGEDVGWGLFAATVGGFAGLVMGILEARAISRAVEAERHRLRREAVEQRNERLDEFAAVVAHDLRNPLSVASGRLELARQERDSEHLETAAAALDRMGTLVDRTLTLARSGHVISETEAVDLGDLVEECWTAVPTGAARLENDVSAVVDADPDRLRHLFENLFRNAVEHGSADGQSLSDDDITRAGAGLTIRVGDLADGFYVADDGAGIPAAKRDAVLDDGYATADGEGGLGLAIVQRIVEAHDWDIDVTESAGGGTRFEITGTEAAASPDEDGSTRSQTPVRT